MKKIVLKGLTEDGKEHVLQAIRALMRVSDLGLFVSKNVTCKLKDGVQKQVTVSVAEDLDLTELNQFFNVRQGR